MSAEPTQPTPAGITALLAAAKYDEARPAGAKIRVSRFAPPLPAERFTNGYRVSGFEGIVTVCYWNSWHQAPGIDVGALMAYMDTIRESGYTVDYNDQRRTGLVVTARKG